MINIIICGICILCLHCNFQNGFFTNELMQFSDNLFCKNLLNCLKVPIKYIFPVFDGIIYVIWTLLTALAGVIIVMKIDF